jgi:phosphoenolpyruvate-protein kinase (PTS system EI component)
MSLFPVHGLACVPGIARGVLSRRPAPGVILVADQEAVRGLIVWPAGCILHDAAPFSHASIGLLARAVPTVIVGADTARALGEGQQVIVDGGAGQVLPGDAAASALSPVPPPAPRPLLTADGAEVFLLASVRGAHGARQACERGAAAVGLVRTEFVVPGGTQVPDARFYGQAFAAICRAAAPLAVTFRLLDLAPDKRPAWAAALPTGTALGLQGARLYDDPLVGPVLDAQIEALARIRGRFPLRVLIPYVTTIEELVRWRGRVARALPPDAVRIGAMVETPGTALMIDELARAADFVGLGSNDLMQCLFGADRDEPRVARYLDPYSPAVFRFLRAVADEAGAALARVQVCGLLSQLSGVLPVLLGLGYRTFSVDAAHVPYLAREVGVRACAACRDLADTVCAAGSSRDVAGLLGVRAPPA